MEYLKSIQLSQAWAIKKSIPRNTCCLVSLEERWFWFTLGRWPDQLLPHRDA